MKLNYNGTIAKIYRWFYQREVMPASLCPYFWQLVLMWIFIIPFLVIYLPIMVFKSQYNFKNTGLTERVFMGLFFGDVYGLHFVVSMPFQYFL